MICCFAEGKIGVRPLFDGANKRNQCARRGAIIIIVQIRPPQKYDDGFGIESNSRSGRHCLRLVKDNLRTAKRERGREGISASWEVEKLQKSKQASLQCELEILLLASWIYPEAPGCMSTSSVLSFSSGIFLST